MLALHTKYSNMVKSVFNNDQKFIAVLDKACAAVINHKQPPKHYSRSPEMVCLSATTPSTHSSGRIYFVVYFSLMVIVTACTCGSFVCRSYHIILSIVLLPWLFRLLSVYIVCRCSLLQQCS